MSGQSVNTLFTVTLSLLDPIVKCTAAHSLVRTDIICCTQVIIHFHKNINYHFTEFFYRKTAGINILFTSH